MKEENDWEIKVLIKADANNNLIDKSFVDKLLKENEVMEEEFREFIRDRGIVIT